MARLGLVSATLVAQSVHAAFDHSYWPARELQAGQAGAFYIATLAGAGDAGYSGDGGPATAAEFSYPAAVAVSAAGVAYVVDGSSRVRQISATGEVTTLAGTSTLGYSGDSGPATDAEIYPRGVAVNAAGVVYIADGSNACVRQVSVSGTITAFAGTSNSGYSGDGGPATAAELINPSGVAVNASGVVYIADVYGSRVRQVSVAGTITTFAGTGNNGFSGDGGPATLANISPLGVAVSAAGVVYIADVANYRIRQVSAAGEISTVAGSGSDGYSGDGGPATAAALYPVGVAVCSAGVVYIADGSNYRIRQVSASGIITTVTGTGVKGYTGDGGPATVAQISYPAGIAASATGVVYFVDQYNNRVRVLLPAGSYLSDGNVSLCPGGTWGAGVSSSCTGACPSGAACPAGTATPLGCPVGFYCPASSAAPSACPAGTYGGSASLSSASCSGLCQAGYFCPAGSTNATAAACPPGSYGASSGLGAAGCSGLCLPGFYGNGSGLVSSTCSGVCQPGFYCVAGSLNNTAAPCPAGVFGASTALSNALCSGPCPAGAYCPLNSSFPVFCPAGTYNSALGATSAAACTSCAARTYSSSLGAAACIPCPSGANASSCLAGAVQQCGAGYYATASGQCAACAPGFFSAAGASSCTACAAGTYSNVPAATSAANCSACPAGTTNSMQGQTRAGCIMCEPGTASAAVGASLDGACAACAAGYYAAGAGLSSCTPCPAGSYGGSAAANSSTACVPCGLGTYSSTAAATSADACVACPVGAVTLQTGSSSSAACVSSQCWASAGGLYATGNASSASAAASNSSSFAASYAALYDVSMTALIAFSPAVVNDTAAMGVALRCDISTLLSLQLGAVQIASYTVASGATTIVSAGPLASAINNATTGTCNATTGSGAPVASALYSVTVVLAVPQQGLWAATMTLLNAPLASYTAVAAAAARQRQPAVVTRLLWSYNFCASPACEGCGS